MFRVYWLLGFKDLIGCTDLRLRDGPGEVLVESIMLEHAWLQDLIRGHLQMSHILKS